MKRVPITRQRGITMVVVLLLMTVMLLGGLALARITESSILVSGNVAVKEASVQASEVGLNTAQAALIALANENANSGTWYSATMLPVDANGIPAIDWSTTPTVNVGRFTVTYAVDRMCTVAALVNSTASASSRSTRTTRTRRPTTVTTPVTTTSCARASSVSRCA